MMPIPYKPSTSSSQTLPTAHSAGPPPMMRRSNRDEFYRDLSKVEADLQSIQKVSELVDV